jgi:hypothetical protein
MLGIVCQMAALAERLEIVIVTVLWVVVQVRHGQDHLRAGDWVRLIVLSSTEFTPAASSSTDPKTYLFPVGWVSLFMEWH